MIPKTRNSNRNNVASILKMANVASAPVDVKKIAELLGFQVIPFSFPDKRRGVTHIEDDVMAIGVNSRHSAVMQRYTIAHELGHYLCGHQMYEKTFVDDETKYYDHHFQQEKEADAFAAELLMPKEFLERDLAKYGLDIPKLKELYQVSKQALWIRLTSLRLAEKYSKR